MGRNKRRRENADDRSNETPEGKADDFILVFLESKLSDTSDMRLSPAWTVEFVDSIKMKISKSINSSYTIPSIREIALHLVRGTLDRISSRNSKKLKKNTSSCNIQVKPTSIQLRIWPALLSSFEAIDSSETSAALNVVGIAPTGTGIYK